jgi:hypothetical protein
MRCCQLSGAKRLISIRSLALARAIQNLHIRLGWYFAKSDFCLMARGGEKRLWGRKMNGGVEVVQWVQWPVETSPTRSIKAELKGCLHVVRL